MSSTHLEENILVRFCSVQTKCDYTYVDPEYLYQSLYVRRCGLSGIIATIFFKNLRVLDDVQAVEPWFPFYPSRPGCTNHKQVQQNINNLSMFGVLFQRASEEEERLWIRIMVGLLKGHRLV